MKVIITGTTGMIGEGVLLECLNDPQVDKVLSVSRKPTGIAHPKLEEYLVPDFLSLRKNDEKLVGYDACFFCAGVSSVGMKEDEYRKLTYDTTLAFANAINPNPQMSFMYVSGGGTDSTERGRQMWARVKGKTENDLMKLPFRKAYGFRIGVVKPTSGQKRVLKYYPYFSWLFPFLKLAFPDTISTMKQVQQAMVFLAKNTYEKNVIKVKDIRLMAEGKVFNSNEPL